MGVLEIGVVVATLNCQEEIPIWKLKGPCFRTVQPAALARIPAVRAAATEATMASSLISSVVVDAVVKNVSNSPTGYPKPKTLNPKPKTLNP